MGKQAADLERHALVDNLPGGLAGHLPAGPVDGSRAVPEVPGDFDDGGSVVDALLYVGPKVQIWLWKPARIWDRLGDLNGDTQQQCCENGSKEPAPPGGTVETVLLVPELLHRTQDLGQQPGFRSPEGGRTTAWKPSRGFGIGWVDRSRPYNHVRIEERVGHELMDLSRIHTQTRPRRQIYRFEVDDMRTSSGGAHHENVEPDPLTTISELNPGETSQKRRTVDDFDWKITVPTLGCIPDIHKILVRYMS